LIVVGEEHTTMAMGKTNKGKGKI